MSILDDLNKEREAIDPRAPGYCLFDAAFVLGCGVSRDGASADWVEVELSRLAAQVMALGGDTFADRLDAVLEVLFVAEGFAGNRDDYLDPANSYVHRVLQAKRGTPLTLTLVLVEVARRVGLRAYGIAFPGHFLAGFESDDVVPHLFVVDAFHRGRFPGMSDLQEILRRLYGDKGNLHPQYLAPASDKVTLTRLLLNLRAAFPNRLSTEELLRILSRLLLLHPERSDFRTERALLLQQMGETEDALSDALLALKTLGESDEERARALRIADAMKSPSAYIH